MGGIDRLTKPALTAYTDGMDGKLPASENSDTLKKAQAALTGALLLWYKENARPLPWRASADPYRVWVSEIMLQQTRAETVAGYYTRFLAALPDVYALSSADDDALNKLWEGLGYYSRAKNLKRAAKIIVGELSGSFPQTPEALERLPGIGAYTAGAIASIAFNAPSPAVDGNVLRVYARLTADDGNVLSPAMRDKTAAALRPVYKATHERGTLTQALMELGATVCTPKNPRCGTCPLADVCEAKHTGLVSVLPVRIKPDKKQTVHLTVFIFDHNGETALLRRPKSGLLSGLYELPNLPGTLSLHDAAAAAAAWGFHSVEAVKSVGARHVFTHRVWEMTVYSFTVPNRPAAFTWATKTALNETYPLPTAFRKLL